MPGAQHAVYFVQLLGLVPTLVCLQGHAQDFVGESDIIVHFSMTLVEAGSQALLQGTDATAKVALVDSKVSELLALPMTLVPDLARNHLLHLGCHLTGHCLDYILAIHVHQTRLSWVFGEFSLEQFEAPDILATLLERLD